MLPTRSIAVHPRGVPTIHAQPNGRYAVETGADVALVFANFESLYAWMCAGVEAAEDEAESVQRAKLGRMIAEVRAILPPPRDGLVAPESCDLAQRGRS